MARTLDPDPLEEVPAPRAVARVIGHDTAEQQLLDAFNAARLHHAWLITGPRGIGKASLAFRFARFLLAHPPSAGDSLFGDTLAVHADNLDIQPDHPVFHRVLSGGHADLMTVERSVDDKTKKLRNEIVVDDVRKLSQFFSRTAGEGGWRIAIIDSSDEMNRNAANALLKILEEPPKNAILLLVCHAPGRLLPTILSRCRKLVLNPLEESTVSSLLHNYFPGMEEQDSRRIAALSHGSPGRAVRMALSGGLPIYQQMLIMLSTLDRPDIRQLHQFAGQMAGKDSESAFEIFAELLEDFISTIVQYQAGGTTRYPLEPDQEETFRKLVDRISLDQWFQLWEKTNELMSATRGVNLDRRQAVMNIFHMLETAVRK